MHELIKRYMKSGKVGLINPASLLFYRWSPHILRETAAYSLLLFRKGKLPKTRFVIFGQGRTGSTLLVDLMNSHPDVFTFGEIFQHEVVTNVRNPRRYAEGICTLGKRPVCGFKVKIYQLENGQRKDPRAVLADFHEHGWRIIYLKRTNLLRHAISDLRSEKTGKFHNVGGRESRKRSKIHIDPPELTRAIEFRVGCLEREKRALDPIPHLTIEYEKDLLEPDAQRAAMNRVFEFLDLPPHAAETSFRKVTAKNIADDVENFEEIERELAKTDYARFLGWG